MALKTSSRHRIATHQNDRRQCSSLDFLKLLWMLSLALLAQESGASPRAGLLIYTHHLPPYTRQLADGSLRGTIADTVRWLQANRHVWRMKN